MVSSYRSVSRAVFAALVAIGSVMAQPYWHTHPPTRAEPHPTCLASPDLPRLTRPASPHPTLRRAPPHLSHSLLRRTQLWVRVKRFNLHPALRSATGWVVRAGRG